MEQKSKKKIKIKKQTVRGEIRGLRQKKTKMEGNNETRKKLKQIKKLVKQSGYP